MTHFCLLIFAFCLLPFGDGPTARIIFSKSFPGSSPEYFRITLEPDGKASYATAPDDDKEARFKVSEDLSRQVFDLAKTLNYFRGLSLETNRKIAFMGKKTVVYENGAERGEAVFNYTENPDAQALAGIFEKISNTQQHLISLEHLMRFDKLGLMKQLLILESAINKNDLAEPRLLVPVLEQISGNKALMGIAQQRARIILAKIQGPK